MGGGRRDARRARDRASLEMGLVCSVDWEGGTWLVFFHSIVIPCFFFFQTFELGGFRLSSCIIHECVFFLPESASQADRCLGFR